MNHAMDRSGAMTLGANGFAVVAVLAVVWWIGSFGLVAQRDPAKKTKPPRLSDAARQNSTSEPRVNLNPVSIRSGPSTPKTKLRRTDAKGTVVTAACSTCHASRRPDVANRQASDLDEFHRGLKFSHSSLSCLSCHNPQDYNTLRMADGTAVEYANVMTLCAQCHGPAYRDYQQGAHGGMTGYWDLSRGPRTRNNCVDCHRPHAPKFPKMKPTFKSRDRFLDNQQDTTIHE